MGMTWPWLTGTAVLLFGLIMNVLNVPQTIAANRQLIQSAARRVRRPRRPASSELAAAPKVEAIAKAPTATPPYLPPAPRYMIRPDYRYNGGPVPTSAVMDLSYMDFRTSTPAGVTFPFGSASSTTAGTAATA